MLDIVSRARQRGEDLGPERLDAPAAKAFHARERVEILRRRLGHRADEPVREQHAGLEADDVEEFQPGPKTGRRFSPGRYVRIAGVERDAVPWPPKGGATRGASTSVTGTRWRG